MSDLNAAQDPSVNPDSPERDPSPARNLGRGFASDEEENSNEDDRRSDVLDITITEAYFDCSDPGDIDTGDFVSDDPADISDPAAVALEHVYATAFSVSGTIAPEPALAANIQVEDAEAMGAPPPDVPEPPMPVMIEVATQTESVAGE